MSWYKKAQKKWNVTDMIEMLNHVFNLIPHDRGPFVQWTKPYLGQVTFMNEEKNIKIAIKFDVYPFSHIEVLCYVDTPRGYLGTFRIEENLSNFKSIPYQIVTKAYEIIDNPQKEEDDDGDFSDGDNNPTLIDSPEVPELVTAEKEDNDWYNKCKEKGIELSDKMRDHVDKMFGLGKYKPKPVKKKKKKRDGECLHSLDMHCDGEDDGW